jgi:hypothetical protein
VIVDGNSADSGLATAPECTPNRSEGSTPSAVSSSFWIRVTCSGILEAGGLLWESRCVVVDVYSADSGLAVAPGCTPDRSKGSTPPSAVSTFVVCVERLEGPQALVGAGLRVSRRTCGLPAV